MALSQYCVSPKVQLRKSINRLNGKYWSQSSGGDSLRMLTAVWDVCLRTLTATAAIFTGFVISWQKKHCSRERWAELQVWSRPVVGLGLGLVDFEVASDLRQLKSTWVVFYRLKCLRIIRQRQFVMYSCNTNFLPLLAENLNDNMF